MISYLSNWFTTIAENPPSFWAFLIPLIAAGIGWFTNFIAIKMLFYPRHKKKFFGISFQGVFPKRQQQLGAKLGELFADRLGVQNLIQSKLHNVVDFAELKTSLTIKVKESALDFIAAEMPFLKSMLPTELIDTLSNKVADKLFTELKEKFNSSVANLNKTVDVKSIVEKEVVSLDAAELEKLLQDLLKKEFRFIEWSGAILGFLIGCLQLVLASFIK